MRIGICGFGNLGRALLSVAKERNVQVVAILSRRANGGLENLTRGIPLYHLSLAEELVGEVDVMLVAGGSATDLGWMTPRLASLYNVVDSFDTHPMISSHLSACDAAAREAGHLALISVGWDPGLLSLARLYAKAVMPDACISTVWGKGLSQGHSDALRRIEGVHDAVQYTVPDDAALDSLRRGELSDPSPERLHIRECYVVPEDGADTGAIEAKIRAIPSYFAGYRTIIHFVTEEKLRSEHFSMEHRGRVLASGFAGGHRSSIEFSLKLDSNPEFTASVMLAYAAAVDRISKRGEVGARTVFDVPPSDLFPDWACNSLL